MLKVEEKVTFIWQSIHPEKFDPYIEYEIDSKHTKTLACQTILVNYPPVQGS